LINICCNCSGISDQFGGVEVEFSFFSGEVAWGIFFTVTVGFGVHDGAAAVIGTEGGFCLCACVIAAGVGGIVLFEFSNHTGDNSVIPLLPIISFPPKIPLNRVCWTGVLFNHTYHSF
jgi:hypothetical protein